MAEAEKKSFLGNFVGSIKSALVEEVPEKREEATTVPEVPAARPAPNPALAQRNTPLPPPPAVIDQTVRNKLAEAVAGSAPPGYAELHANISALAEDMPDENARFRAAVKLAIKKGHSVPALLGDVDKCVGILEAKKAEFEKASSVQVEKNVRSRQTEAGGIEANINAKMFEIERLQREVQEATAKRAQLLLDAENEAWRLEAIKTGFVAAYESVKKEILDLRNKIEAQGKS